MKIAETVHNEDSRVLYKLTLLKTEVRKVWNHSPCNQQKKAGSSSGGQDFSNPRRKVKVTLAMDVGAYVAHFIREYSSPSQNLNSQAGKTPPPYPYKKKGGQYIFYGPEEEEETLEQEDGYNRHRTISETSCK